MIRTIAAYPGGKHTLAPLLVRFMPNLSRNISGFGGMANEILAMPQRKIRIYNDKDKDLCILLSCFAKEETRVKLFHEILKYEYCKENFMELKAKTSSGYYGQVEIWVYAAWVWYTLLVSRDGGREAYSKDKDMEMGKNFQHRIMGKKWDLMRLEGIGVWNKDIYDLIEEEIQNPDGNQTFYFLDSPYYGNKASYKYNMVSDFDHNLYCKSLVKLKGAIMVCGYDNNNLYDEILVKKHGFKKIKLGLYAVTMGYHQRGEKCKLETECIWINY